MNFGSKNSEFQKIEYSKVRDSTVHAANNFEYYDSM